MGNPTIRTQDNRGDWIVWRWRLPYRAPITLERWRPSLLWRAMHRLGVA